MSGDPFPYTAWSVVHWMDKMWLGSCWDHKSGAALEDKGLRRLEMGGQHQKAWFAACCCLVFWPTVDTVLKNCLSFFFLQSLWVTSFLSPTTLKSGLLVQSLCVWPGCIYCTSSGRSHSTPLLHLRPQLSFQGSTC